MSKKVKIILTVSLILSVFILTVFTLSNNFDFIGSKETKKLWEQYNMVRIDYQTNINLLLNKDLTNITDKELYSILSSIKDELYFSNNFHSNLTKYKDNLFINSDDLLYLNITSNSNIISKFEQYKYIKFPTDEITYDLIMNQIDKIIILKDKSLFQKSYYDLKLDDLLLKEIDILNKLNEFIDWLLNTY